MDPFSVQAMPYREKPIDSFETLKESLATYGWADVAELDLVRWAGFTGERISRSPKVQAELRERVVRLVDSFAPDLSKWFANWWWRQEDVVCLYSAGVVAKASGVIESHHIFPVGADRLVAVNSDGMVTFWNQMPLEPTHFLQIPVDLMLSATLTTKGSLVLVDCPGDLAVIDPETMKMSYLFGGLPMDDDEEDGSEEDGDYDVLDAVCPIQQLIPAPDGHVTAVSDDSTYWTLGLDASETLEMGEGKLNEYPHHQWSSQAAWDGAAVLGPGGEVHVVDRMTGAVQRTVPLDAVAVVPWVVGGLRIPQFVVACKDALVRVVDPVSGQVVQTMEYPKKPRLAVMGINDTLWLLSDEPRETLVVAAVNMLTGKVLHECRIKVEAPTGAVALSDGRLLVSNQYYPDLWLCDLSADVGQTLKWAGDGSWE